MATALNKTGQEKHSGRHAFIQGVHGFRYQVRDVARSVEFYTTHLGFTLAHQRLPAFASVSFDDVSCCSAVRKRRDLVRCRTVSSGSRAAGIVSCFG